MPSKKKYAIVKRRRHGRRRRRKTMPLYKNPSTGYLSIKQKTFEDRTIPTLAAGLTATEILTFQLQDVQNQFPSIFDQFRINYVKCTFWAVSAQPGSTVNNKSVMLYTSVDLDGQNPLPATEQAILQRANTKQRVMTFGGGNPQFHTHSLRPRTAEAIYASAVLSGYGLGDRKKWLDIRTAVNAPHYGLVYQIAAPDGIGTFQLRVQITYYLQFRKII